MCPPHGLEWVKEQTVLISMFKGHADRGQLICYRRALTVFLAKSMYETYAQTTTIPKIF